MARPPTVSPLLVVLVVLLAGCTAPTATGPSTTDAASSSPPPSGGTANAPASPAASFPDGTSADGVESVGALLAAHDSALNGTDHRFHVVARGNVSGVPATPLDLTVHRASGDGGPVVAVEAGGGEEYAAFAREGTLLRKNLATDATPRYVYRHSEDESVPRSLYQLLAPTLDLNRFLGAGDYDYAGRTDRNGTTLLRFEAVAPAAPDVSAYEGTLLVSPDGIVHAVNGSMVRETADGPARVEFSYTVDLDVGVPERPKWVAEVPRLSAERVGNGTLALTQAGGPLPAGTPLSVYVDGDAVVARNLSLPTALADGETVYVVAVRTGNATGVRLRSSRPSGGDGRPSLANRSVLVTHRGERLRLEVTLPPANGTA